MRESPPRAARSAPRAMRLGLTPDQDFGGHLTDVVGHDPAIRPGAGMMVGRN
jgi:hypothetical protein